MTHQTATYRLDSRSLALDVHGHGRVAKALIARAKTHNLPVTSVHNSKGLVYRDATNWGRPVLVDCTAPAYHGTAARDWIDHLESNLYRGIPVVTCNKAPLALAWSRLDRAARVGRTRILASATVGAGTPVLDGVAAVRDAHGIARIEASLSGTLSYIVDALAHGHDLEGSVAAAQAAGYAEPDPTLDLNGTDALAKAVILHNTAFRGATTQTLPEPPGALLDIPRIREAAERGLVAEIVAAIRPGHVALELHTRQADNALAPPPGHVAVRATSHDGAHYEWRGPGAGVAVTAGSILSDIRRLDDPPGIGIRP